MGGNQSNISVNTATENLVESIMNTTQKSAINTNISQDVLIDTTEYSRMQSTKYNECLRDNRTRKPNEILEFCKLVAPVGVSEILVKGTFDISKSTTLTAKSIQDSASNIVNDISAKQEQTNSGFSISNKAKTNIVSSIKQHSKLIADTINEAMSNDNFNQKLEIRSGNTKGVSMNLFIKYVSIQLNNIDVFQKSVQDIKQQIVTENTQKNSGLGNILIAVVVILSIILILFFVYKMYSRKGGRRNGRTTVSGRGESEGGSEGESYGEGGGNSKSTFSTGSYIGMFIGVAIIALLITLIVLNSKNKGSNDVNVSCKDGKCETK